MPLLLLLLLLGPAADEVLAGVELPSEVSIICTEL